MNQDELLRAAAQAHYDWAVKNSARVPVDRAMSNPHDGVRSDLEEHHLDVCAPPEIDDELNQRLVELLAQADEAAKADWDEAAHPRGSAGKWVGKLVADVKAAHPGVKLDLETRSAGHVVLSRIVTPERSKGTGSKIMQQIVDEADRHGHTLALTPSGDYGGSPARLKRFYARFGFKPNKGRSRDLEISEDMVRLPQTSKADEGPVGDVKARHLIEWFNKGADGKIRWGTPGDFDACVRIAGEHMPPEKAKGFCANRHHDATGEWPGPQAHKSDEGTDD